MLYDASHLSCVTVVFYDVFILLLGLKDMAPQPTKYAGIGSRITPPDVMDIMMRLGVYLAKQGLKLRSGAAMGADSSFEMGCRFAGGELELWLPWKDFQGRTEGVLPTEEHYRQASQLHPYWLRLGRGAQALHARNTGQILGLDLKSPVDFVICYTPDGMSKEVERSKTSGGTATAIVLADRFNIPVFNLAKLQCRIELVSYLHRAFKFKSREEKLLEKDILELHVHCTTQREIFVFGSNQAGRHGLGAALYARDHCGAKLGQGFGLQGRTYAIPTKDWNLVRLPIESIAFFIDTFKKFAKDHMHEVFFVSKIGCGLAGYKEADIIPLFKDAPANCKLPVGWRT